MPQKIEIRANAPCSFFQISLFIDAFVFKSSGTHFKDTYHPQFCLKNFLFWFLVPNMQAKLGLGVIEFASQKFFPSEKNFAQIAFGNFRSENFAFSLSNNKS